ncbi:hypothetical protein [[Mycobacterium] burgundiense]|uniref:Alpha/beta hydrolase n=1 Tax=[Mycobacterium] burgundiense TaxID=3064286 RepID=A0ABM9M4M1_9MYCO|nr:hypothetical protein [Mycolicibacterium sp. MU0053]CAJ1510116.1 hypothetical protein MU0053_004450 [Mycolicibacterium sp. MU0053]
MRRLAALIVSMAVLVGCASETESAPASSWVEDEVSFVADGLTIHGTYRHRPDAEAGPAALLISESGNTDRNGDNAVAGPVGNMRLLAEELSERGVASLRYDKVGTGATGLGPYAANPAAVGSAVYTAGARAAFGFLAEQPGSDPQRLSAYGLGEGATHALALADGGDLHAVGLLQPLSGRYLDLITQRVRTDVAAAVEQGAKTPQQADEVLAAWAAAVRQARDEGAVDPRPLPDGLSAILNPANVTAVVEADAIDPLAQSKALPDGMAVLLTCSDADGQARCDAVAPLAEALAHTDLTLVEFEGVNHVLRDDPTDNVANYANGGPLSEQLTSALDEFIG